MEWHNGAIVSGTADAFNAKAEDNAMRCIARREFLSQAAMLGASLAVGGALHPAHAVPRTGQPNILMIMADDLGYGDTGFNGNTVIHTPSLDALRAEGARFTRFYAGGPVCSPTRATCMTGRHYCRYGITHANVGCLPRPEITVAEVCRDAGYITGHFGKWHLGTLTKTEKDGNRGGPEGAALYSPPWEHGFDTCFSTEALVPTWDPALTPAEGDNAWGEPGTPWKTAYWDERGERVRDNLAGDDARVIVDRVEPFIRSAVSGGAPFLGVVWFHTPHAPVVAGDAYRQRYAEYPESQQHYFGCITAMDEQIGWLNALLKELAVDNDTIILFCSDNGPEGKGDGDLSKRFHGSAGAWRGRKRSLFNGGITVPALVKWPGVVEPGSEFAMPCSTLDYLPTIAELVHVPMPDARPLDGINLLPMLHGAMVERPRPIPLWFAERAEYTFGAPTLGTIGNRYKVLTNLSGDGAEDVCFDLLNDPDERANIVPAMPEYVAAMRASLREFVDSCRKSHAGADYAEPYTPVAPFQDPTGDWKR